MLDRTALASGRGQFVQAKKHGGCPRQPLNFSPSAVHGMIILRSEDGESILGLTDVGGPRSFKSRDNRNI